MHRPQAVGHVGPHGIDVRGRSTSARTSTYRETASWRMSTGFGRIADPGHVAEPDLAAVGRVDEQVADAVEALADVGNPADDDLEDLLLLEQAADVEPLTAGWRRPGGRRRA